MTVAIAYWVLMLLWLVFGVWGNWPLSGEKIKPLGGTLLFFVLLLMLGWRVFGAAIRE